MFLRYDPHVMNKVYNNAFEIAMYSWFYSVEGQQWSVFALNVVQKLEVFTINFSRTTRKQKCKSRSVVFKY